MKYLIVPNSFKECLPAREVGNAIKKGILSVNQNSTIKVVPVADGGQGTLDALLGSMEGSKIVVQVYDPILQPIEGFIGLINDGRTAIIEMAEANGIERLEPEKRNPLFTSSFGTGQLILKALDLDCEHLIIGLGGSATNDGGIGMASALGVIFLDSGGKPLKPIGESLLKIEKIDLKQFDNRIKKVLIQVISDVENPFYGEYGATFIYGPQKGADSEMVIHLEKGMQHLASLYEKMFHTPVNSIIGGGAAGGLGVALKLFAGAEIISGIEFMAEKLNLVEEIQNADIIISAEGQFDGQTFFGKAPLGLSKMAKKYQKPFFVFTGNAPSNLQLTENDGITAIIPITKRPSNLADAIQNAGDWLTDAGAMFSAILECGIKT